MIRPPEHFPRRLRDLRQPQYRHFLWLLFFPVYWLRYPLIERMRPVVSYCPIRCPLDDKIPFVEWFIVPYLLWMGCLLLICAYTLVWDVGACKRYMKFLTVSMSISTVIYLVFPSCQELRPDPLPRDNLMCRCVAALYALDTNTNVFPSEHVIGAIAVWIAAMDTPSLRRPGRIWWITVLMLMVALSTVFLKQHSVLDGLASIVVCAVAYRVCYKPLPIFKFPQKSPAA